MFAILVDTALTYNRVHPGVSISGVDAGGKTPADAEAALAQRVQRTSNNTVTLVAEGDRVWHLLPADVDARVDTAATVAAAMGLTRDRSFLRDLGTRFSLYFSKKDVPLEATIDPALLDSLLAEVSSALDVPPVNAGLTIQGNDISVVEGRDGLVVDTDAVRAAVKGLLFALGSGEVPIPTKTAAPAIQAADTSGAVDMARTMLSAPVKLKHGDDSWSLSSTQIAKAMDFTTEGEGQNSRLVPLLAADKLGGFLEDIAKAVKKEPTKATWKTDGERATIVGGTTGTALDPKKTAEELTRAALNSNDRIAKAQVVETPPERTVEQAKQMGIVSKLASYTTEFGGSEGRRKNVARAAELISDTLLAPGAEFDFDSVVGQRTPANGFTTAPAIIAGKLEDSLGGGICQVSTTLYNAVFFAGLDVTARANHSIYISHYPKGRDATVSWGGPAFRFVNDTPNWILIKAAASWSSLTFVLYGTPVNRQVTYTTGDWYGIQPPVEKRVKTDELPQGKERVADEGQTGKSIKVTRRVIQDGKTIHQDTFVSNYPMRPKIIEEGTRPTTTTTLPATSTTLPATSTTTATTTAP
ncbi:MAG: VanW family protein [Thermoleophilia bacterium]